MSNETAADGPLDRLMCPECFEHSQRVFQTGHFYCSHTKLFVSIRTPNRHRKLTILAGIEPDELYDVLRENLGKRGLAKISRPLQ